MAGCQVSASRFKHEMTRVMKQMSDDCPDLCLEIPTSWERYTDLVLFPGHAMKSPFWYQPDNAIWDTVCDLLKVSRVGIKGRVKRDGFRTPKVTMVRGPGGTVHFTYNKIKYSWDVEMLMFSRGNASERLRVSQRDCRDLTVVDLFAGIGYFSLPYLVHARAARLHACEWNPLALQYLRNNLILNNVAEKCIIHEGDNRQCVGVKGVGEVINVGILPDSEGWWGCACEALSPRGGTVYLHQAVGPTPPSCPQCRLLYPSVPGDLSRPLSTEPSPSSLETVVWLPHWLRFGLHILHSVESLLPPHYSVTVHPFKVKSYAPHIDHLVYTVECRPRPPNADGYPP